MKKLFLASLLILLLLGSAACSPNKLAADSTRLRSELAKWDSFRSEGVIRINYMGLELRKYYVAAKHGPEFRLDIIDGGIIGAGASPLISVYLGEYFALESPFMPQLELMNLNHLIPGNGTAITASLDSLVDRYEAAIISDKVVVHDSLQIRFNPSLQLQEVQDLRSGFNLSISYDNSGEPDQLDFRLDRSSSVSLLVDRMSYGPQEIEALARPEPTTLDLQRLFEQQLNDLTDTDQR